MQPARNIRLRFRHDRDRGEFVVTSPDLPDLKASGPDADAAARAAEAALREVFGGPVQFLLADKYDGNAWIVDNVWIADNFNDLDSGDARERGQNWEPGDGQSTGGR